MSMIQAASVGVGLVGKEGRQASLAADFSILQFNHIRSLFLVSPFYFYFTFLSFFFYTLLDQLFSPSAQAEARFFFSLNPFFPSKFIFIVIYYFKILSSACAIVSIVDSVRNSSKVYFNFFVFLSGSR